MMGILRSIHLYTWGNENYTKDYMPSQGNIILY